MKSKKKQLIVSLNRLQKIVNSIMNNLTEMVPQSNGFDDLGLKEITKIDCKTNKKVLDAIQDSTDLLSSIKADYISLGGNANGIFNTEK